MSVNWNDSRRQFFQGASGLLRSHDGINARAQHVAKDSTGRQRNDYDLNTSWYNNNDVDRDHFGRAPSNVITFLFGFVAAWRHDFGPKDASILNRMVLRYAVPLALFAGTVTTSRAQLSQDIPLIIALCFAIIGLYGVVYFLCRTIFRWQSSASALAALTSSTPAVPFVGPGFLGDLFAQSSAIPIAIASLVINLTVVPVTILLLEIDATGADPREEGLAVRNGEASRSHAASHISILVRKLAETVEEPLVWAPVLAFVIVLIGWRIPLVIVHSLCLLGNASGGVALFAAGLVLASGKIKVNWHVFSFIGLKNIVQSALVLGGLRGLGYGNPIVS